MVIVSCGVFLMVNSDEYSVSRAALYIRVSTEEQAMHGLSLIAQRDTLEKYAADNHMKIVGVYADEGITARKKYRNRIAFMRMLRDAQAGKIDVILFIKLDRWFRNIADYYEVQKILDECHVQWIATEERYDTTTANGRLNLNIRLSIAQDESDRTSERIKFVFENKVQRNEVISGKVPLGYTIQDKKMVPDPSTRHIPVDIFNQYINCRSMRSLRKYVMDKYGMVYTHTGLRMMLQNERYIGKAHGLDDFCEPIVDKDIFNLANSIIGVRGQRTATRSDKVYLFSGLVFCSECGRRLSAHVVSNKYIYYRCTRYEKLHLCSHNHRTPEPVIEKWLLDNLIKSLIKLNQSLSEEKSQPDTIDTSRIRHKMDKLRDLYLNDLIERESYESEYLSLKKQISSEVIETRDPIDLSKISSLLESYGDLSRSERKAFWSRIVSRIVIDNEDNIELNLI